MKDRKGLLTKEQKVLRRRIFRVLKQQGFKINPHIRPAVNSKDAYRKIQRMARLEQISLHKKFLTEFLSKAAEYCEDGYNIIPENISLELRLVEPETREDKLFRWWNFVWWSIPYQHPYGRQMKFMLWDKGHDLPFGLILLQSPVLRMSVRDNYLKIPIDEIDIWVNKSMSAQRVGALPPYNDLLGGKMVALSMTCNEIREAYRRKYNGVITLMEKRRIDPDLLFITTTSAFGKSSIYDRLRYKREPVAQRLGYTQGVGSFHVPQVLYEEIVQFLKHKGANVAREYGNGPSRKIRLMEEAFDRLRLSDFTYHGIRREFYLFPLVRNLENVIHQAEAPDWIDRPFTDLVEYWRERWAYPRSQNLPRWKDFSSSKFISSVKRMLSRVEG
jgi:hypothetical protein